MLLIPRDIENEMKAVTQNVIARKLRISRSAVKGALCPDPRIRLSPQTRQRVLDMAHRLNYRPNRVAMSLRTKVTHTIGVLVPTISGDVYDQMMHGIESVIGHRYSLLLGISEYDAEKERQLLETFEDRMVDGLIVVPSGNQSNLPVLRGFLERGIPMVQAACSYRELSTDVVEADNEGLGCMLTQQLLNRGLRRIYFLRSPRVFDATIDRTQGYERAMRERGLEARSLPALPFGSEECAFDLGHDFTVGLLNGGELPFGIVANDLMGALGALQAVQSHGLRCPADVAIAGVRSESENPVYKFLHVPLTLAELSVKEIGCQAARLLFSRLEKSNRAEVQTIHVPGHLVETDTARPDAGSEGISPRIS